MPPHNPSELEKLIAKGLLVAGAMALPPLLLQGAGLGGLGLAGSALAGAATDASAAGVATDAAAAAGTTATVAAATVPESAATMFPAMTQLLNEGAIVNTAAQLGIRFPMSSMVEVTRLTAGLWTQLNGGARYQLLLAWAQANAPQAVARVGAAAAGELSLAQALALLAAP
jgi:hypothetical protein